MPYDPESGVVTRAFGPQLLFRGRHDTPRGIRWGLRLVVGWDPKISSPTKAPVLNITKLYDPYIYRGWRRNDCTVGTSTPFILWVVDFDIKLMECEQTVPYEVTFATETQKHAFHVPGIAEDAFTGYFSCNDIENPLTRNPDSYASWQHLLGEHNTRPYHVLIAGGDQIYGDEALSDKLAGKKEPLETMYLNEYLCRFADEPRMAKAMATIPFLMQPDDHDYYNGVGSWGKHEPGVARRVAHRFRFLFQVGRSQQEAFLPDRYEHSSHVFQAGPNVVLLSLDMRSNREVHNKKEPMMLWSSWRDLMTQLHSKLRPTATSATPKHVLVLFAVPLMFMQSDTITKIAETFKSAERTDFRDSPLSQYNRKQTAAMLSDLFEIARKYCVRMTFISGDAHVWGTGTVKSKRGNTPFEFDHRAAQQWISSPMCNNPEKILETFLAIAKLIGKSKRKIDDVEMSLSKLHAQRNFMRIWVDSRTLELNGIFVRDEKSDGVFTEGPLMRVAPLQLAPPRGSRKRMKGQKETAKIDALDAAPSSLAAEPLPDLHVPPEESKTDHALLYPGQLSEAAETRPTPSVIKMSSGAITPNIHCTNTATG